MIENKCFCEKCKKIQYIKVIKSKDIKEFNIGKISYDKLKGLCLVCEEEVYSLELSKKNKIEINKKIKDLEEEVTILKIIKDNKSEVLKINDNDEELLKELQNILLNRK